MFVVNGTSITSDVWEAAALSPFVREQLSVDACGDELVLNWVELSAMASLQSLLSGSSISVDRSKILLSGHFGNAPLERHFLGCSNAGIAAILSRSVLPGRCLLNPRIFPFFHLKPLTIYF
jgi:hypothetical protein